MITVRRAFESWPYSYRIPYKPRFCHLQKGDYSSTYPHKIDLRIKCVRMFKAHIRNWQEKKLLLLHTLQTPHSLDMLTLPFHLHLRRDAGNRMYVPYTHFSAPTHGFLFLDLSLPYWKSPMSFTIPLKCSLLRKMFTDPPNCK